MAKNIVTFGLKNVKYSKIDIKEGLLSYGPIKSLKGAQEITVDLIGGSTNVYGDDYTLTTFNAYAGNTIALKMTEVTDEFKIDILGYERDENNNLVEVALNKATPFALGYELDGDKHKRRIWFLFCTATPVSFGTKSKTDTVEANSTTLNITSYALIKDDYEYLKVIAKEGDSNYETFFDSVPEVDFAYDKVLRWNPSTGENDSDFVTTDGTSTSVSGYTYNGKSYSRGTKISSSLTFTINVPERASSAELQFIGYANSTSNTSTLAITVNGRYYETSEQFNTKDIKELKMISFNNFKSGDTLVVSKGSAEAMLCEIVLILHYK